MAGFVTFLPIWLIFYIRWIVSVLFFMVLGIELRASYLLGQLHPQVKFLNLFIYFGFL
jgi:hypothetical protein